MTFLPLPRWPASRGCTDCDGTGQVLVGERLMERSYLPCQACSKGTVAKTCPGFCPCDVDLDAEVPA